MSAAPCPWSGRLGTEPLGHEGPPPCSSTASCQGDAPQRGRRLARGAWQLLLLCGPGLVELYGALLGLQATLANTASHCLCVSMLGLCILCGRSLQVTGGLVLACKLSVEVPLPIQQALWQLLTVVQG